MHEAARYNIVFEAANSSIAGTRPRGSPLRGGQASFHLLNVA